MISKGIEEAINKQINAEIYSAYLYLSMEAYFHYTNLKGFANWMNVQVQEELAHARIFFDYLSERGGRIELFAVDKPAKEWKSPLDVFEATYKHEQEITAMINNLMSIAKEEKDYATMNKLQWFIDEQVEEEGNDVEVIESLKLVGERGNGLLMIDRELAQRVFTPPAIMNNKNQ